MTCVPGSRRLSTAREPVLFYQAHGGASAAMVQPSAHRPRCQLRQYRYPSLAMPAAEVQSRLPDRQAAVPRTTALLGSRRGMLAAPRGDAATSQAAFLSLRRVFGKNCKFGRV